MRFSLRYPVIKLSRLLHYYIDRGSILSYNSEQRDDNGWMNFKFTTARFSQMRMEQEQEPPTNEEAHEFRFASHGENSPVDDGQCPRNKLAPFNPTDISAQHAGISMLNLKDDDVLYDLGCGDGRK